MQMNQYKGHAWFHRLRSHFSAAQTTEGLVCCVSHTEMMEKKETADVEGRARRTKDMQKKKEIMTEKKTQRDSRFPISRRRNGMWNIYWKDCPVLSVSQWGGEVVEEDGGWGAAGLGGDETRSVGLSSRQLISASCWRLAERKNTAGGLAS